jgi:metallophosphoesterase superfamily enzyme
LKHILDDYGCDYDPHKYFINNDFKMDFKNNLTIENDLIELIEKIENEYKVIQIK